MKLVKPGAGFDEERVALLLLVDFGGQKRDALAVLDVVGEIELLIEALRLGDDPREELLSRGRVSHETVRWRGVFAVRNLAERQDISRSEMTTIRDGYFR